MKKLKLFAKKKTLQQTLKETYGVEQRPWNQGYMADRDLRLPESANPYPKNSDIYMSWRSGWYDSHYEGIEY